MLHISNAFGKIHDIEAITKLAHSYGAVVLVDGAQSLAHLKVDMQKYDCDFLQFLDIKHLHQLVLELFM